MRRFLLATLLSAALAVTSLAAQAPVAGTWEIAVDGPQGRQGATLTLEQDGSAITGTIASDMGTADLKGEVAGTALQVHFDMPTSQGAFSITLTGAVDGDAIKGSLNYGQGTAPFTGTRKK